MARRRFLVNEIRGARAELRGADAHHLARVLRAEPGQRYEISDGESLYVAEVSEVGDSVVAFHVLESIQIPPPSLELAIFPALIKFDRFEWLIEKATELGVSEIIPVNAARTGKGLLEAAHKRLDRWRRIARESSQQARRLRPPEIHAAQPVDMAFRALRAHRYFLDEEPGLLPPLLNVLPPPDGRRPSDSVALLAGPEGGWTDAERAGAVAAGWTPVSLGPLVLRAETAGIAAAALLAHAWWASRLE